MEYFYYLYFGVFAVFSGALELKRLLGRENGPGQQMTEFFYKFRNNYLLVYSLMMAGDWLQGPYVYKLYTVYGFDRGDIGRLFIAGFGSSMVFGTIVGSLADKWGRKKAAIAYCVTYIFGCFTKHYNNFNILLLGRVFCGIATSLLYSAFESWVVCEHFKRAFHGEWLGNLFSNAVLLGNGVIAILAGLLAQLLVGPLELGPVSPFDAAATVLLVGGLVVAFTWTENYGDAGGRVSISTQFSQAAKLIYNDPKIAMLGAMQSLFEGAMYTFVFLWTPALSPHGEDIPHGFIFAIYMVACMAGSALAGMMLAQHSGWRVERYMQVVFLIASATMITPVLFHLNSKDEDTSRKGQGLAWEGQLQLASFCVFEVTVGLFWPSMMKMRSEYVPEECRATIINFFRIPLNLFVCVVLYNVSSFPLSVMFGMCSLFLAVCMVCQARLEKLVVANRRASPPEETMPLKTSP